MTEGMVHLWSSPTIASLVTLGILAGGMLLSRVAASAQADAVWPLEWFAFGPVQPHGPLDISHMANLVPADEMKAVPDRLTIEGR